MDHKSTVKEMKELYGIEFQLTTEDDAINFLENNTYAPKLIRYLQSFEEISDGPNKGRCLHVDFLHLNDLSVIDMRLRKCVLSTSLDLEHSLKTSLMNHASQNFRFHEEEFIEEFKGYLGNRYDFVIGETKDSFYNGEVYRAYQEKVILGRLIELLSFGDFSMLFKLYSKDNFTFSSPDELSLIAAAKNLRNAAAHNASLLIHLNRKLSPPTDCPDRVRRIIAELGLSNKQCARVNDNQFMIDFISLIFLTSSFCSPAMVKTRREEFLDVFDNRFGYRLDIYKDHPQIIRFREDMIELIDLIMN